MADDSVRAWRLDPDGQAATDRPDRQWREVEVELLAGTEPQLAVAVSALLAAGARPASNASKYARAVGATTATTAPSRRPPTAGDVVVDWVTAYRR